ncbi:MAG: ATP-binding protein [Candidatus Sumerlaeota bacterium]|nr:ATP-binding protein [Candidatus Sumerlaeota bacterium]
MNALENKNGPAQRHMPYSLFKICAAMTSTLELDELLGMILDLTLKELQAERGSILLYDEASDTLKMLAARGMPEEVARRGYIPRKGSIAEYVVDNNEPLLLNDGIADNRFTSIAGSLRSSVCCPLRSKGNVIGTLNLTRLTGDCFTPDDLDSLMIMATQAAVAIENARLIRENVESERLAAIGQTVSGISHCVKNMLTSLKGGMSLADLGIKQNDWSILQNGWKMLNRSVNRISLLVLDMLDFSKEREPSLRPCNMREILEDATEAVRFEAEKFGIAIRQDLPAEAPRVLVDGDQIFRCILNLATNAVDAVHSTEREDGWVQVGMKIQAPEGAPADLPAKDLSGTGASDASAPLTSVSATGAPAASASAVSASAVSAPAANKSGQEIILTIWVADNGGGIPADKQKDIFKPFFSTKGSKGTGLGLAVTQKVVREHGGRIELDNEPGKGVAFRLVVPCKAIE